MPCHKWFWGSELQLRHQKASRKWGFSPEDKNSGLPGRKYRGGNAVSTLAEFSRSSRGHPASVARSRLPGDRRGSSENHAESAPRRRSALQR